MLIFQPAGKNEKKLQQERERQEKNERKEQNQQRQKQKQQLKDKPAKPAANVHATSEAPADSTEPGQSVS